MTEIINFDDPVVLVGGGEVDVGLLQEYSHLPIVAADGGANLLKTYAIEPAAVIGDLDSVENIDHWQATTKLIKLEEQDTTDFEKCLYSINAPHFITMGFTGNRFDHTLAALHVMQKWQTRKSVVLVSGKDVVCVKSGVVDLELPVGTRVSIYPFCRVEFSASRGLRYPLDGLAMQSGQLIGVSNISSARSVKIVPKSVEASFALILPVAEIGALTGV